MRHKGKTDHGWGIRVRVRFAPPIAGQARRGRRAEPRRRWQVIITQMTRGDFHRGGCDASIDAQWDADEHGQHGGFALCMFALRQDVGDHW
jgi:hypothetical protein